MRPRSSLFRLRFAAVALVLAVVAAACSDDGSSDVIVLSRNDRDLAPSIDDVQPGQPVDGVLGIEYATLDGGTGTFTDFAGTPLVINFFAAWCASCVAEMPRLEEVFRAHDGEVAFLGISEDVVAEKSIELIDQTGITYPTGWDPNGAIHAAFGAFTMPTTVFVTADGQIAHMFGGALTAEFLDDLIEEHLL